MTNRIDQECLHRSANGYNQFGKGVFGVQIAFATLMSVIDIDTEIHREIDFEGAKKLRDYYMKCAAENLEFYLHPLTFSGRGNIEILENGWRLKPNHRLYILDGKIKIIGMSTAIQFLQSKKVKAELEGKWRTVKKLEKAIIRLRTYPMSLQIYLNLTLEEEKKLFTDFNRVRKEVHKGKLMQYDQRNEYTILTRRVAKKLEHCMEIETALSRLTDQNSALTSLSVMNKCAQAMWEGSLDGNVIGATRRLYPTQTMEKTMQSFYKVWLDLFPENSSNRKRYVSGLAGIQISLAYTVYLLTKEYSLTHREAIHKLTALKLHCTWKHDDPHFSFLYDTTTGRIKHHSKKSSIERTAQNFITLIIAGE